MNRIATVFAVLALYLFHGRNLPGMTISLLNIVLSLWSSAELSRFAYGRLRLFGAKQFRAPSLETIPTWLQWVSFCTFVLSCILVIWSLPCWRYR